MTTNVAKKDVKKRKAGENEKKKPAGKDDKLILNGISPKEVETDKGKYELLTIPGKEISFRSIKVEDYIKINAYPTKEIEKEKKQKDSNTKEKGVVNEL